MKAVSRAKWSPTPYNRLCGDHFVGKKPSDDPEDIDYVPTIFADRKGQRIMPRKRGGERLEHLERRKQCRLDEAAAQELEPALAISDSTPSTSDTAHDPTAELDLEQRCSDVGTSVCVCVCVCVCV